MESKAPREDEEMSRHYFKPGAHYISLGARWGTSETDSGDAPKRSDTLNTLGDVGTSPATSYVIRGGERGRARMRVISAALRSSTLALLGRAGIAPGMACLDLGCGGGDVTLEMVRLVGPEGKVVGVDMDAEKLRLARQDAEREHLDNVEYRVGDASALDEVERYDVVYARLLLTHLRDPRSMVERMVRSARPGGVVIVEDMDHGAVFSHPACPALERHMDLYDRVTRLRGADPQIGPRLPDLLRQAGLGDVQLQVVQPAFLEGDAKRIHRITLENIAGAVTGAGIATPEELAALGDELDAFARDPRTLIGFPRIFQVWAYRR